MEPKDYRMVIGFTALDFSTGLEDATRGKLAFVIKDHPSNADRHALLLGKLIKSALILSYENGKFSVTIKEPNNGNSEP